MRSSKLWMLAPALILALAVVMPVMHATTVQYVTLASFDFLSSDELSNFANVTLAGSTWNTTLTSATVSNGELNISNKDTSDALLVYPVTLNGYAEVTLSQGVIGVFSNYNGTGTTLTGYEIVKTSSGITVYSINGTSKTAVASVSTTADTLDIAVMDGELTIKLKDGTGVYQAPMGDAVIALGAPASDGTTPTYGVIDKVVLYGVMLAGSYSVNLGSKTITPSAHVAAFNYDVSKYKDIQSAKLYIKVQANSDPYMRYYVVSTTDPGQVFWKSWPSSALRKGVIMGHGTIVVDVTDYIKQHPQGTFYVGISCGTGSWSVQAQIALDAQGSSGAPAGGSSGSTTEVSTHLTLNSKYVKYAAIGAGVLVLLLIVLAFAGHGGHRRRGIATLLAAFIMLLVMGGIAAAVLAWLHPEWLMAVAFGLGALAVIVIILMLGHPGRTIPNPAKPS